MAPFLVRLARVFSPRPKRDPNEIRICYASGLPKTHPSLLRHVVGEKGYVRNHPYTVASLAKHLRHYRLGKPEVDICTPRRS